MTKKVLFSTRLKQLVAVVFLLTASVANAQAPTITSFSPTSGAVGTSVTITGTGFNATDTNNVVYLAGMKCPIISASTTSLVVTIPKGSNLSHFHVINKSSKLSVLSGKKFIVKSETLGAQIATNSFRNNAPASLNNFSAVNNNSYTTADIDGNGKLDILAMTNGYSLKIGAVSNTPSTLNFGITSIGTSVLPNATSLSYGQVTDMNNDGLLDYITANGGYSGGWVNINSSSSGSPSFLSKIEIAPTASWRFNAWDVAIGDYNMDGKMDVIGAYWLNGIAYYCVNTSSNGSYSESTTYTDLVSSASYGTGARAIVSGDFNNDGKEDYYVTGDNSSSYYLRNTATSGAATLSFSASSNQGLNANILRTADLDGDGDLDIIAASNYERDIFILTNNGSGTFSKTTITEPLSQQIKGIELGDLDGDGDVDLIYLSSYGFMYVPNISSSANNISFDFTNRVDLAGNLSPSNGFKLVDVNEDNKLDILYESGGSMAILVNEVGSLPTITLTGTLTNFTTCSGTASTAQTFSVSGSNLTANIDIAAVTGYQYSIDNTTFTPTLSIPFGSGTVAATTVYVRMSSAATGTPSGNISITSTGATTRNVAVSGSLKTENLFSNHLNFDGTNDFVEVADNNNLDLSTAFTVEAWVYPTLSGATQGQMIIGKVDDTQNGLSADLAYAIRYGAGGFVAEVGDGTSSKGVSSGAQNVKLNQWQHVAMVFDGTTGNLSLYIDGVLQGTSLSTGYSAIKNSSSSLKFGAYSTTFGQYFKGGLDEVRIWNVAKTQAQIQSTMFSQLSGVQGNLVVQYNFNQGTAGATNTSVTSLSGLDGSGTSAHSGTFRNIALAGTSSNFVSNSLNEITGSSSICSSTTYTFPIAGGTWASSNTGVLSINSAGVVTTVAPGTANITYTYSMYGCTFVQTKSITVTGIVSYRNTLDFDGTNDYLTVPDNNALDLTTNYTLEAWVKADGFNWLGGIISKYNSNGSNGYVLRSNQVSPYTGLGFDGKETANGVLQLGVWHHIAAVKEGNSRKLYVDGTEVALTSGYSHTVSANSDPVIIGKDFLYETNSRYWNGKIDEIRIWNIAKTQAQVQALKDNELVGNESGLVLYYNFNQGTAGGNNSSILSVLDGTSAARNASIVNFDKSGSNSNFIANDNGPVIVGPSAVCVGLTATYTNRTTGGTWGTSNSSIFTVSTSGVLTAIAAGTADLTYTFTSNNCTFTVSNSITISPTPTLTNAQALTVGDSPLALTGSGTPASSNAWVSSNTAAATISSLGVVTPVGNGTTTITYTNASGCSATASINVKNCAMPFGNALSFGNGSISSNADYVEVNSRILPTTVANFTIETWVKPSASDLDSNFHGFIGSNGRNPSLYIYEGGKIHASYVENTGTGFITPNVLVNQDKWSHLALVKNGTTITLYVNGLQAYSQVCAANFTLNDNYYWLGKIDNQFNGALDEVRFWSTARTQAEIQAAMNTELVGTETGLLTYFDFNQGIGGGNNGTINTVTNKANNALNGSLNGFTKTATASNFVGSNIANLDISGAATICSNSSSQYSHPIAGGTWSISTSGANATISASGLVTSTVNENITLSYTYTLNGCPFTVTKVIAVSTPAAPVATTVVNVCQGTTATALTANALNGHALQWYTVATAGTANTSAPTPSRSASGSTLYYVSQKNNASTCEGPRTTITVTVNPATAITTQPVSPSAVCLNASSNTISVTATGQNLTYQWYTNTTNSTTGATAITNATTNSYVIPTNVAGTKYYYVVVTGTCGSPITSTIVAQVINISTFTTDVSSAAQNIAYGGTATALTVGSPGATAYQWYSTPTKPSLLSGFSGTAGFTSSLGAFQAYSFGAGQYPAINDGVLTFAYRDNTSVSRDFDLDQTATTISFSTEYAETDIGNNRAGDTGKIQLQFLNASNVAVGTTVESALLTGTLTYQTVSLANVSIPTGATKARVIFLQVNETEGWAGNYGIAFRNPSVTTNVALNGTAINGATAASYTPLTTTPGALYYYAVASGGCSTASSSLSGLITVAKANPTIASMAAISKTVGDAAFTLTAPTSNSTGAFTFTSSNTTVATISGTTVTVVGAGTATITATQATDVNYNEGSVTTTLTVAKANPTIASMSAITKTVGDAAFTLTAPTSNSTGAITYTSSPSGVVSISGSTVTIVGAGTATITATQASSTNYNAGSVTATITVAKRNPTIASMATIAKTFGAPAFALTAPNSNSTGVFTYTSSDTDVVTISGSTVTIVGVGTATITATQASSTNYNTGSVTTTITVAKANPTLGSMAAIAKTYGDTAFTLTAPTSNSTGAFTYTSGNNAVATIAGSTVTIVSAGTATITIAQAADINYNAGSVTVSLTVAKAARTLTNFPNLNKTTTDVPFTLVAPTTSAGTGVITYTSSDSAVATINGATVTIVGIGTSVITATQAADANYEATSINATLTVIIGDSDGDGVSDAQEAIDGTNPNASDSFKDTDNDGVADSVETENDTDPNDSASFIDTDNDGVPNYVEARQGTSPTTPGDAIDSDRDGVPDYVEVQQGTNPIVPGAKDTDGDGVADYIEVQQGTSPTTPGNVVIDTDADGVPDYIEVQQGTSQTNPSDAIDSDGDGVPNYVEVQQGTNPTTPGARDTDGDGVPDFIEKQQGTNPTNPGARDTDGDGVPDYIEAQQGTNPTVPGDAIDTDGDGVPNYVELQQGTNPTIPGAKDTDGDGVPDYVEVQQGTSPTIPGAKDTDGDGVADYIEVQQGTSPTTPGNVVIDTDADGVPDYIEVQQGTSPTTPGARDTDGDGVPDYVEVQQGTNPTTPGARDTDGDGVPDYIEVQQGTNPATPGDAIIDTDRDGVPDYVEVQQGTNPTTPGDATDTDGDGVPDYVETQQGTNPTTPGAKDTDGDGVPDYVEVQQGTNPTTPGAKDTDGDGVPDYVEVQQGTNPATPGDAIIDTDSDGVPDYVEVQQGTDPAVPGDATDTDRDGVPDYIEVQQGTNPTIPGAKDTDGDGVPDYVEVQQGTNPTAPGAKDTDGDGVPDYIEVQQGTNPTTPGNVVIDTDSDGVPDYIEVQQGTNPTVPGAKDTDGDGVPDYVEVQQGTNPTTPGAKDTDGDGVPDYVETQQGTNPTTPGDVLTDTDGDGVPNYVEVQQGTNPAVPGDAIDTDGDGVPNYVEVQQGTNPTVPGDAIDADGDGVPNYVEAQQGTNPTVPGAKDTDGDGVPDYVEVQQGTNPTTPGDTIVDTDRDGVPDYVEVQQGTNPTTPGARDTDGDGVPDYIESQQGTNPTTPGAKDTDGDGVPDYVEVQQGTNPTTPGAKDTDGDGVPDYIEVQQGTNPTTPGDKLLDNDGDGVPNYVEVQQGTNPRIPGAKDTDGDGVPDYVEVQQGTNPTTPGAKDTDGDGVPDYIEVQQGTSPTIPGARDTDGDSVPDYIEIQLGNNPAVADAPDADSDGMSNYEEGYNFRAPGASRDTDRDGTPDYLDLDSDGDSVLDRNDAFPINPLEWTDSDDDGTGDNADTDDDNDGILDACDVDVNGDGIPDNGTDLDADGINDGCDTDKDGDGVNNTSDNCPSSPNTDQADRDRDGLGDVCDTVELDVMQALTPNGDGINDTWVIYNLGNHPGTIVRVFNSNGTQVFYSANYQNNWTGNYEGRNEMLPVGSYMFQIDLGGDGSIDSQGWMYISK